MYWMMCLDPYRLNAYEEAIRQYGKQQKKAVWLDIGTGAHMPLTRLLIKYGVAEHVYAVEANRETYQFA
jgi:predicted RNA methylase